jgi:capsular exopolysaccharide synthesis family protein
VTAAWDWESANDVAVVEPVLEESDAALGEVSPATAAFLSGDSRVGEAMRGVATQLRLGDQARSMRSLAVVSAVQAEGKTSVSIGLAAAYARAGQKVLLIDADLRRRDLCRTLGIKPEAGLAEWLESGLETLPVRWLAEAGFHVLAAGRVGCRPELLGSARLATLLSATERCFDSVIVDCAPLLTVADSLAFRGLVGGFVMVVRARQTPRDAVVRAASFLQRDKLVGVVLNGESTRLSKRRGYRYGYGYGTDQSGRTSGSR